MKVRIIKLIHQAVLKEIPEYVVLKKLRGIVKDIPYFNIREKAQIYLIVRKVTDLMYIQNGKLENRQIKRYYTGLHKVEEHRNARERRENLKGELRLNRANKDVFYICSWHEDSEKLHAEYQGKIYVDRFWRSILAGDEAMQKKVQAYIRNHNTMTVQDVIKGPVYLITRPYCRHFLVGLSNEEVLGNSVNKLKERVIVRGNETDYKKKFYRFRKKIQMIVR